MDYGHEEAVVKLGKDPRTYEVPVHHKVQTPVRTARSVADKRLSDKRLQDDKATKKRVVENSGDKRIVISQEEAKVRRKLR